MLAIEIMIEEILRLQNAVCFLQAQLREARKMQETNWFVAHPEVTRYILKHEQAQELIGRMCAAPLVIRYDERDELVHTDEHPFCDDPACGCHDDVELIEEYYRQPQRSGLMTHAEAQRLFYGKQV